MIEENKILIQAVKEGNLDEVNRLLEKNTFGVIDYSGNTILHIGACSARPGICELILEKAIEKGVDLRNVTKNKWGSTPLDMAINLNNKVAIEAYRKEGIHAGVDLKKEGIEVQIGGGVRGPKNKEGSTALHNACLNGSPAEVKALIEGGANIEAKNKDEQTPLHFAAFRRNSEIAEVLLSGNNELGVKAKIDVMDTVEGWSPLAICLQTTNSNESLKFAETLLKYGANVNITDNDGCTPLMQAAVMGLSKEVKLLIQWGADTNIQINENYERNKKDTALHIAAENHQYECVKILLVEGKANVCIRNTLGETALDRVNFLDRVMGDDGRYKDVKALLEFAKLDTILHTAARESNIEDLNRADSENVNSFNAMGNTPIHSACGVKENEYSQSFLRALIAKGGNVNLVAGDGYNPLQISAEIGSTGYIKLLLEKGADVNSTNEKDGNTALHYAAMKGQSGAVEALLEEGANHTIRNHKGESAFDIAKNNKDITIIGLLNSRPSTSTSSSHPATSFSSSRGGGRP